MVSCLFRTGLRGIPSQYLVRATTSDRPNRSLTDTDLARCIVGDGKVCGDCQNDQTCLRINLVDGMADSIGHPNGALPSDSPAKFERCADQRDLRDRIVSQGDPHEMIPVAHRPDRTETDTQVIASPKEFLDFCFEM